MSSAVPNFRPWIPPPPTRAQFDEWRRRVGHLVIWRLYYELGRRWLAFVYLIAENPDRPDTRLAPSLPALPSELGVLRPWIVGALVVLPLVLYLIGRAHDRRTRLVPSGWFLF